MLVLSRKKSERIVIGDDIVITVVEVKDGKVRLGLEAPRDVPIVREEITFRESPKTSQSSDYSKIS